MHQIQQIQQIAQIQHSKEEKMKALVKEIFIGVLLLMVVVFTLGILFYDSMPNNKATSTSITYTADSKVTATIQQITEET